MSTTIDQRVVEMRFDNKQFERGVSETMTTLEKLKQRLNFRGAVKGAESINSATKGMNTSMSGLGGAVEQVSMKFSALQIMGVTALTRLTNSAINAGTRIAKALTIEPVTTGFKEYETQINAVQTIQTNTGAELPKINKALEELNKYADQTIYNFTEMTRNIGTFTAAGVDLDTSTSAIKGIANLAAVSGSTSQQASTAMYQLSQALAAGRVSLMDWNSVVNAGMGGKVFQDALTRTADVMNNGAASKAIKKYGSFRESLTKGEWLSTDVLTETLKQFTMAAEEGSKEWNEFKESLKEKGYTEEQATAILKMANTATNAATKVKTFTQLWDVLKESAQSGWSQTWKLIIGDFEEAKSLLTPIAETLTGFINRMSDFRNRILEIGLNFSKPWTTMMDKLGNVKNVVDNVGKAADKLEYFQDVVSKVWRGDYKNSDTGRYDLLEKAGYDHRVVQDLVNKGYDYKITVEDIEASHKKFGLTLETTQEETKKAAKNFEKLSDEKLKDAGLTEDEIALYRALEQEAAELGISVDELADNMSKTDGRSLLIDSFKNIGDVFVGIGKAAKEAWIDIFNPPGAEVLGIRLYGLLESLKKFTESLRLTDKATGKLTKNGEKIMRTFKGVFAIIDLVSMLVGGVFKVAFKIVTEILDRFGFNLLDVTAAVGDAIVEFRDWVDSILNISGVVDFLIPLLETAYKCIVDLITAVKNSKWFGDFCDYLNTAADGLKDLFASIPDMSGFQSLVTVLKKAKTAFQDWIQILKDSDNIPGDIIAGLAKGITAGVPAIIRAVFELGKNIISGICDVLGIHSPSTVMIAIGGFIIAGLVKGILDGEATLTGVIEGVGETAWIAMESAFEFIKNSLSGAFSGLWKFISDENGNVDWGKIFAGGMMGSLVWVLVQFANAFKGVTGTIGGIGDILDNAGECFKRLQGVITGYEWDLKAKALMKLSIAIAIMVGAIWLLTKMGNPWEIAGAVVVIGILAGVLVGLAVAMDKFGGVSASIDKSGAKIDGLKMSLMKIALAIGVLALVVKMIGDMEADKLKQGLSGLLAIATGLIVFMGLTAVISRKAGDSSKLGGLMIKLAISMALMVMVVKMVSGLSSDQVFAGILFVTGFTIFVAAIALISRACGNIDKLGGLMIKLAIAMALMVGVCKLAGLLSAEDMFKGALFAAGFVLFVKLLTKGLDTAGGSKITKVAGLVMGLAFGMALMVGVCKLVSMLSLGEMVKGAAFVFGFTVLLRILINILTIGNESKLAKVTGTILAMAVAIGILALISVALSHVKLGDLVKGVAAVGALGLVMAAMIKALKGANEANKSIMMMAVAIGVMAAAIIALSFIDDKESLQTATTCLAIVMGMFALIAKCSKDVHGSLFTMTVLVVVVGLLAGMLYLLASKLTDVDAAIGAAVAIGILLTALAASIKMVDKVGGKATGALPAMAIMLLIVAGVAVILGVLDALDVSPSIETAAALSVLLLAMAGVTAILSIAGAAAPVAIAGAVALAAVVAIIGALMIALGALCAYIPDVQKWLDEGIVVMQKVGEGIGKFVGGLIGGLGEGLMDSLNSMIDTFGEIVEKLVGISEIGTGINTAGFDGIKDLIGILGDIALTMAGSGIADLYTMWTTGGVFGGGQTTMEKFEADGKAFFKAMGAIAEASTGITIDEDGMDSILTAAEKLVELQNSIGTSALDSIIAWFSGKTDLSMFGEGAKSFITSMKDVFSALDETTITNETLVNFALVISAAKVLVNLQKSIDMDALDSIIAWFSGKTDLSMFGEGAKSFIKSMIDIFSALNETTITQEAIVNFSLIIAAAQVLVNLQKSIDMDALDSIIAWFSDKTDLSMFGEGAKSFIESMKKAFDALGEDTTVDAEAFDSIIVAAEKLVEFQKTIDTGLLDTIVNWFTGKTDLGTFGDNVKLFAQGMGTLKDEMGEDGITQTVVDSVTYAGAAIIALQEALPTEGWFDGKMNLTDFANYITDFGTAMGGFNEIASALDLGGINATINVANRIKDLIKSLVGLDTSGLTTFTGIGTGGAGADGAVYEIGEAIVSFSNTVTDINTSAVSTAADAALKLKDLIRGLVGLDASGVANFHPETIGAKIKAFSDSLGGTNTDTVNSAIQNARDLRTFISSLSGLDATGADSFKAAIDTICTIKVSDFVSVFSESIAELTTIGAEAVSGFGQGIYSGMTTVNETTAGMLTSVYDTFNGAVETFKNIGTSLIKFLVKGITDEDDSAIAALEDCATLAVSTLRDEYDSFYGAGTYLVSGFANGISDNTYLATAKAKAMAEAAEKAARDALKINSPSKVFKEIGGGIPEGFALGIKSMTGLISRPLANMNSLATKSVSDTVAKLASAIDSDMDVQPTIRPVLDLSNIRSGAGAIGGMLNFGSSVGVLANVGAISRSMNSRGQNVSNADVVSAIDRLDKHLDNVGNTTYTIGGITYDDGSGIANAVKDIARYARMDRRS